MTGKPYSDAAYGRAFVAAGTSHVATERGMDAAHDREALGLDASVCARTFLNEIAEKLRGTAMGNVDGHVLRWAANLLLREYETDALTRELGGQS